MKVSFGLCLLLLATVSVVLGQDPALEECLALAATLDRERGDFTAALDSCRAQSQTLENDRQLALNDVNALRNAVNERTAELETARQSHITCTASLQETEQVLKAARDEAARLLEQASKVGSFESELAEVRGQLSAKDEAVKSLTAEVAKLTSQVEGLAKEKKESQMTLEAQIKKQKETYEAKMEKIHKADKERYDSVTDKLRIHKEQLAKTKESLFETRRELHDAIEELKYQRLITDNFSKAKKAVINVYAEDSLGAIAMYHDKIEPRVEQFKEVAIPAAIQAKDFSIEYSKKAADITSEQWKTTVKPFILEKYTEHVKPLVLQVWEATADYRAIAYKHFEEVSKYMANHPIWKKYPVLAKGQKTIKDKTCTHFKGIQKHYKDLTKTHIVPDWILDSTKFLSVNCNNIVICVEGLLVTFLMMSLTSWLLSLVFTGRQSPVSTGDDDKKMNGAKSGAAKNPQAAEDVQSKGSKHIKKGKAGKNGKKE